MIWVAIIICLIILIVLAFASSKIKRELFTNYASFNSRDMYRSPCPDIDYARSKDSLVKIPDEGRRNKALKELDAMCTFEASKKRLWNIMADNSDFLIMSSCVSSRQDKFIDMLRESANDPMVDFPIREIKSENGLDFETNNFLSVRSAIKNAIIAEAEKMQEKRVNGPIYAVIFQVPNLISEERNGDIVSYMNQNASAYGLQPLNIFQGTEKAELTYFLFVLFPGVKKLPSGQVQNVYRSPEAIQCRMNFDKFKVNEELCFIRCNGENTDVYPTICGCKSMDGKSRCLGPNAQSELMDYGIIYEINQDATILTPYLLTPNMKESLKTSTGADESISCNWKGSDNTWKL